MDVLDSASAAAAYAIQRSVLVAQHLIQLGLICGKPTQAGRQELQEGGLDGCEAGGADKAMEGSAGLAEREQVPHFQVREEVTFKSFMQEGTYIGIWITI